MCSALYLDGGYSYIGGSVDCLMVTESYFNFFCAVLYDAAKLKHMFHDELHYSYLHLQSSTIGCTSGSNRSSKASSISL